MKKLLTSLLLVLLSGGLLHAGSFKDGPYLGHILGGDVDDPGAVIGWQVAYLFNDIFSIELAAGGMRDDYSSSDLFAAPFEGELDIQMISLGLTGRAGIDWSVFHFYGATGPSLFYFNTDAEDLDEASDAAGAGFDVGAEIDDDFGWIIAAGAEWRINERWEVFVEYRYITLSTDIETRLTELSTGVLAGGDPGRIDTLKNRADFEYDHDLVRVGANYRF